MTRWMRFLTPSTGRVLAGAWLAVTAALLQACGGVEGQGTGSAAAYSEGPITGYGSIIVNGVHFDESRADISDDEGHPLTPDDLKLGMTVRVDAGAIDQGTAVATAVQVGSDLIGPVTSNDLLAHNLGLLGQTVRVTASTVFDDALTGGQAAVTLGSTLQVFAILDPVSGVYAAQRIELKAAPSAYKLRGVVSQLDKVQHTFRVGGASFSYAQGIAPADLANGQTVRLQLQTQVDGNGRWVVTRFDDGRSRPAEGSEAEIESVIATFTSNASFTMSGLTVNAASARIEPAGATLAAGLRVEVEGTISAGVLVATKVEVKGSGDDGGDDDGGRDLELGGRITQLDTLAKTFVLREQVVAYAGAQFDDNRSEADLANDKEVEVRGRLSADGTVVLAERIKIED
ncbi:MAG TPA: DUF5666 domain-containing protein [Ideonella sp.]|uniref:DUF5666 domain-containing protein n=1 Tax=Ideonella sp. TaxID=1929293 RepID=UPI002E332D7D|nr:DUF5666 domain-containing protein [Ideonella sp.]HEX5684839.1 DUF5666 domain-containing protein [Ideonella sp.]